MGKEIFMQDFELAFDNAQIFNYPWRKPEQFDPSSGADRAVMADLMRRGARTLDKGHELAEDLFEMTHPSQAEDETMRQEFMFDMLSDWKREGNYFYFPWLNRIDHFPDVDTLRKVYRFRDKLLLTDEEAAQGYKARPFVAGQSVGRAIAKNLVLSGLGGAIMVADSDRVSFTNLNRLYLPMSAVGQAKVDITAKEISERDPYLEQIHFNQGIRHQDRAALLAAKPSIIFDAVDHMPTKAMLRDVAIELKVPLIMATDLGDKTMVDVERYDLGGVEPFLGKLSAKQFELLLAVAEDKDVELSKEDAASINPKKLTPKLVGVRNASPRMLETVSQIGKTLGGHAQLGTTVERGGASAVKVAREIVLGRKVLSGRYIDDPKETFNFAASDSLKDSAKKVIAFVKSSRQ